MGTQGVREMSQIKIKPTCRYGHGALLEMSKMYGPEASVGLLLFKNNSGSEPGILNGLSAWVCKECGYVEIFDADVGQTLKNMEATSE
jgi:hypothetical protein